MLAVVADSCEDLLVLLVLFCGILVLFEYDGHVIGVSKV